MDPIAAIGDQRRRMIENTQRSSSALHSQTVKRHKDRMKRGGVNSSYHTEGPEEELEGEFLEDDDGDSDYSGSSNNAELFRQMWEDDVEANIPEAMAGDTIFDEGPSSGLLGTLSGSIDNSVQPCSDNLSNAPYDEKTEKEDETLDNSSSKLDSGKQSISCERDGAEIGPRSAGDLGASAKYTDKSIEEAGIHHSKDGLQKNIETKNDTTEQSELKEIEPKTPPEDPDAPSMEQISMGATMAELFGNLNSLLDNSEELVTVGERSDIIQIHGGPVFTDSMPREELPPVSADIGELLDKLIIGNTRSSQIERLRSFLGRFGKGVLGFCLARNTKVHLVPAGQLKGVDLLRGVEGATEICGGIYVMANHTCYIDEYALATVPYGSNPVLFFMAQAWDHALGEDDFASLHSPAVMVNFEACRTGLEGHNFADELSAKSPVYYFAQSVEAYLGENDCQDVLWDRDDLYDFDRSMFDYLEYLFKQGNRQ